MTRDAMLYPEDIIDAIRKIIKSLNGVTKDVFLGDDDLKDATIRRLEIIGEAAKQVPFALRKKVFV